MSDIKEKLRQHIKDTDELILKIKEFQSSPRPILIKSSVILKGLSVVLLGAAALLAPKTAVIAGVIKIGGKLCEVLASKKEKKDD